MVVIGSNVLPPLSIGGGEGLVLLKWEWVSLFFFLLAGDMAKSAWSVRSVILFLEHQACWASPDYGQSSVATRSHLAAACFSHAWRLLQFIFFFLCKPKLQPYQRPAPFATAVWAAPPFVALLVGIHRSRFG